jgi:signal transduction histidine kinase
MCEDEATAKKYYEEAEKLSLNLLSISDDFSANFAKTVSERKTIKIQDLITHSLDTVEKTRGLDIEVQGNFKESDLKINCFPQFVELAFRDIINNAIKYSRDLKKSEKYLKIDIQHESDDSLEIIFENRTKELIPDEKLKSIFDPFMRGTKRIFGKGLGLSLAGLCIKLHKGEIKAENVKNRKAVRFKITFPKELISKPEFKNENRYR